MWVQVYNLPLGYFSELMASQFGDFVRKYVDYDRKSLANGNLPFVRIPVFLVVRIPLARRKKLNATKEHNHLCLFKFECLSVFCFLCELLGHTDVFCKLRVTKLDVELKCRWGVELRADSRRRLVQMSSWLRNDQGEIFGSPTRNSPPYI